MIFTVRSPLAAFRGIGSHRGGRECTVDSRPISSPLTESLRESASTVFLIERMGLINCDTQKVLFKSEGLSTAAVAFIRLSMRQVGHQSELVPWIKRIHCAKLYEKFSLTPMLIQTTTP